MSIPMLNRRELIGGAAGASALATLNWQSVGAQATPASAATLPADGAEVQEFRTPAVANAVRLDPHFAYSVYAVGVFAYRMWSGLTKMDANLGIVGDIATSWDLSDDGLTYTFHLDPNRTFSDGTPITANDVAWSWTRSLNPDTQSLVAGGYLKDVVGAQDYWLGNSPDLPTGYKAVDDQTFEVTLKSPKNYFPAVLIHPCTFIIKQSDVEAGTADSPWQNKATAFSGPYMMTSYEEGQALVLEPSPAYPTQPLLKKITFRLVDDLQTQLLLYQNDEVDFTAIAETDAANLAGDAELSQEMLSVPQWWSVNLYFRNGIKPFDDENVRKAFAMAINKPAILTAILKDLQTDIQGIYYPGMTAYNPAIQGPAYDADGAKAALAASTYASADALPAVSFWSADETAASNENRIGAALQEMWRQDLGVEVETRVVPSYEEMLQSDIQIVIGGEAMHYPDASGVGYFLCASGANISQFCDPAIDEKYEAAGSTQDQAQSTQMYQEIETDLIGRVAFYPIYQQTNYFLVKPRVKNLKTTAMYTFPDWEQVYIAAE